MFKIIILWCIISLATFSLPGIYYIYMKRISRKPWNLRIDKNYSPYISFLIPTYNEEKTIQLKLKNLSILNYPINQMQIIVADDASADNTVEKVKEFMKINSKLDINLIRSEKRLGKSNILNYALQYVKYNIIVMTDADAFLAPNILVEALPYLSDSTIGAVIGRQKVLNSNISLATKLEDYYLNLTYDIIRLGQSKAHSTVISHGSFVIYKKEFLKKFNIESDDSGTTLDIIQRGARTIYIPEAICFDLSPVSWKNRFLIKIRRANHNVRIYVKCLKLLIKRQLLLPKKILIPEMFIYLINPIIFIIFLLTTSIIFYIYLPYSLIILFVFPIIFLNKKYLFFIIEIIQNYIILFITLIMFFSNKRFISWVTERDTDIMDIIKLLSENGLI